MEITLISEELFKLYSPLKDDTFTSKFVPYALLAQKIYIYKILGMPLVEELQTQIKAAIDNPEAVPYPITEQNQALLQMIAPPLSNYAVYQGIPFHWAAIVNKGVTIRESENSKGVSINDLSQLRRWLKDDAEELARQLVAYLCECQSNYPLWSPRGYCGGGGCGQKPEGYTDFGIYIPNR